MHSIVDSQKHGSGEGWYVQPFDSGAEDALEHALPSPYCSLLARLSIIDITYQSGWRDLDTARCELHDEDVGYSS